MTQAYWIKIGLGALAIFVAGMTLFGMGRRGTEWVDNVAHSAATISIPIVFVPFRFDGSDIGSINRIDILRDAPDQVTGAQLAVALNDGVTVPAVDCQLAIDDLEDIGDGASFYCASVEVIADDGLVPFGTVEFASGAERSLLLPQEVIDGLADDVGHRGHVAPVVTRRRDTRIRRVSHAEASAAQDVALEAGDAAVSIRIVSALEQAGILLRADSLGAAMNLYDHESGDALVMRADSHGFVMSVKEGGEARMQMRADSNGFQLHVTDADGKSTVVSDNN